MTALLLDPVFKNHRPGVGHPECPERYDAITAALSHCADWPRIEARDATHDEIALCHSRRYIALAEREIRDGVVHLTATQLAMLLDGLEWTRVSPKPVQQPAVVG